MEGSEVLRATLERVTNAWRDGEHPDEGDLARADRAGLICWLSLMGGEMVTLTDAGRAVLARAEQKTEAADEFTVVDGPAW